MTAVATRAPERDAITFVGSAICQDCDWQCYRYDPENRKRTVDKMRQYALAHCRRHDHEVDVQVTRTTRYVPR